MLAPGGHPPPRVPRPSGGLLGGFDLGGRFRAFHVGRPALALFPFVVLFAHIRLYFPSAFRLFSRNMKSRSGRFNIYLLAAALTALAGCKTPEESRIANMQAVLRFYVEASPDGSDRYQKVDISGIQFNATKSHVLDESSLSRATVISTRDHGYALQVNFDDHGKLVLDAITAEARGKHLVIFTQFGVKKTVQDRWLAAPLITRRISNGQLIFTPNATREEADDIALGLSNVIAKRVNKAWWW
jgi:hypothetical protein